MLKKSSEHKKRLFCSLFYGGTITTSR